MHHPKNKTEEGFADCREVIRELAQIAYDHGAVFLLETYVNNVVGSVEETVRMFAEIDHPGLACSWTRPTISRITISTRWTRC